MLMGPSQLSVCATSSGVVVIADATPATVLCQFAPLSEAAMTSLSTTEIVTHSASGDGNRNTLTKTWQQDLLL